MIKAFLGGTELKLTHFVLFLIFCFKSKAKKSQIDQVKHLDISYRGKILPSKKSERNKSL